MSGNVNITKSSPRDYDDNPVRGGVMDYTTPSREYRPAPELVDWRVVLARVVTLLVLAMLYGVWKTFYCWGWARVDVCAAINRYEPLVILAAVVGAGALMAYAAFGRAAIRHAEAQRTGLVLDRFGNQVPADLFRGMDTRLLLAYLDRRYQMDVQLKTHTAQYEQYWSVNTLSGAGATTISTTIDPQLTDAAPASSALVADTEWMQWIDKTPHLLLSARTSSGKTTLAMAILAARAGEPLLILDPHDQPDKWFGMRAIGGGRKFDTILASLSGVLAEMDVRYTEYDAGKPTEDFERLTVLIDEVPALVAHTMDGQKTIDTRWKSFAKKLGSEARKVRISVILLTQSPLVQDIQISSYMRENFTRIALGDQVGNLLTEEKDAARRQLLSDALRGREYAAAMEYKNEIHCLDTTNVPRLAQMPAGRVRMWMPARAVVSVASKAPDVVSASVPGAIVYPPQVKSKNARIAWLLRQKYSYRFIETELDVSHATIAQISKALQRIQKGA